tara:strand:+ start:165 stop:386 length:222 start_codon:yes stop_codon:yes gene_type:complete
MPFYNPERDSDRFKDWRIAVPYILRYYPESPELCYLATRIVDLYITQLMADHKYKNKSDNNNQDDDTNDSEFS